MKPTDVVVVGASGTSLFGYITNKLYGNLTDLVYNENAKVYEPAGVVSIVIPAFNEEDNIETMLKSILSQNIILKHADYFECIVVDNDSTDRTAEIAKEYCQVIFAPRGKLNARHKGITGASGDIIVSVDADTYYPPNWLNLLIAHFHNPDVVAVKGPVLAQGNLLARILSVWVASTLPSYKYRLPGANSAFLREAYFKTGGFDLSVNQFDREKVFLEEEFYFYEGLKQLGEVIYEVQASCFTSLRHLGKSALKEQRQPLSKYVKEIEEGERF